MTAAAAALVTDTAPPEEFQDPPEQLSPEIPREGRILAVDPGSVRTGLALSDPLQTIASPLEVWTGLKRGALIKQLVDLVRTQEVVAIVVGLPLTKGGEVGPMAQGVMKLVRGLQQRSQVPVLPLDERFTSRGANAAFEEAGVRASDRRGRVDMVAAALLLQEFLDRRSTPR